MKMSSVHLKRSSSVNCLVLSTVLIALTGHNTVYMCTVHTLNFLLLFPVELYQVTELLSS